MRSLPPEFVQVERLSNLIGAVFVFHVDWVDCLVVHAGNWLDFGVRSVIPDASSAFQLFS